MKLPIHVFIPMLLTAAILTGCSGGGRLSLNSAEHEGQKLRGSFNRGVYDFDGKNSLNLLLIEGEADNPTQAVHVQLHWEPRAGRTPIDEDATNAVVHYMVFSGEGAGVYSGAGFLFPQSNPGDKALTGDIRNATLRLLDSSEAFVDPLGLSIASGSFRVIRDDLTTQRLLRQVRLKLREKLGYPRLVNAE